MMKYVARVHKVLQTGIHGIGKIQNAEVVAREALPLPDRVEIEALSDDSECMMYRYTRSGEFGGDTWHENLDSAFHQAEHEYGLSSSDFLVVRDDSQGAKS